MRNSSVTDAPGNLRVDHLDGAVLGLGHGAPVLSWTLPLGSSAQRRSRVEIDGRVLEWVDGADHIRVAWPGETVAWRTRCRWRVQVETDLGVSEWSEAAWFETTIGRDDWTADWIEPQEQPARPDLGRPAYLLRRTFTLDDLAGDARLYATAHGIYEVFLNGRRVGDQELTPGFTSYWHHLDVQTYDVGPLMSPGANELTVVLSDGWYRGKVGNNKDIDTYGDRVAFLAQLHAGETIVGTDREWRSATGPILAADLMDGQEEDRRIAVGPWAPVVVADHGVDRLTASPAPPTRRVEEVPAAAVHRLDADRQVVDLGQNIHGWVRLDDLGPRDTELVLTHGEALDAGGDVTLEHLCFGDLRLRQVDRVVSAGVDGDVFEPRHTAHGFQFVRVEGHPYDLAPEQVTGVVVHTDLRRTGWFSCSDERLNRLHDIVDWSFRDNACEIPTDCPQRERSGWTGDWQAFFPSAAFLYDVGGFSRKWLRSLVADQLPSGCLTNMAPEPRRALGDPDDPMWTGMLGSAGWGDAVILVPWMLRQVYGDDDVLADTWPAMVRWLDYAAGIARDRRHHRRAADRPTPAPHEQFLWDAGWHWGEWLEPGEPEVPFWDDDQGHVATAYLHHSAAMAARIGRLLDHHGDADRFDELADRALDAWRTEYLHDDGTLVRDTQATHVRALAFGLVPDELREPTASRLVELVRRFGNHLSTGFLATPHLLPVLADAGHLDVAYDLLFQDTPPSWLTMVDRGATTVWESWEGIDADGTAHESLNHYSKGAVIRFLHEYVAGIQPVEGELAYRHFRLRPRPGGGLTSAQAAFDSPRGRIEISWQTEGADLVVHTTVPPGTTAELVLPNGTSTTLHPGTAVHRAPQ